jgi:curved DNA-binding protein CbpA
MTASSLYDILGVRSDASHDEVRSAYLARARMLHPDRLIDADDAARANAEREMQALNEAFRVLGHDDRRRDYDRQLAGARSGVAGDGDGPGPGHRDGNGDADDHDEHDDDDTYHDHVVDPILRLVRALPWIVILLVLLAIFVFTAYAGGRP